MNASDIISLVVFLVIVGSSIIQSLFKNTGDSGTKSSKSLSEIKKYLEEMAQGTNPDTANAQTVYTQPYASSTQKTESQAVQKGKTKRKNAPTGQRGFDELLNSLPPVPEKTKKAVMMSSSTPAAKSVKGQRDASAVAFGQTGFEQFNLPSHLTAIQKAMVVTEILKQPKAFEY